MKKAKVFMHNKLAGYLIEIERGKKYEFTYEPEYFGPPISLTMPTDRKKYEFDGFPPFFDGLLPEGFQLEGLLRMRKIDRDDLFGQIVVVGQDLVGAVCISEIRSSDEEKNE